VGGQNDISSQQTRSVGSNYTKNEFAAEPRLPVRKRIFGVFRAQETSLVAVNVFLFLLN